MYANSGVKSFPSSDPKRLSIYQKLRELVGPGPAAFYWDACNLLDRHDDLNLKAASHLIAHLTREIESALRHGVLQPAIPQSSTQDPAASGQDRDSDSLTGVRPNHRRQIRAIVAALAIEDGDRVANTWFESATVLSKYAHRNALDAPRPLTQEFFATWQTLERVFVVLLDRIEARALHHYALLDQLLSKPKPAKVDVSLLTGQIPQSPPFLTYFFSQLTHPEWLDPLHKKGYFDRAPHPEVDGNGHVWFPPFPQADYLARMSPNRPNTISDIIRNIECNDHVFAQADLLDAVLGLPVHHASALVPIIQTWIETPYEFIASNKVSKVAVSLAQNGYLDETYYIIDKLLQTKSTVAVDSDEQYWIRPHEYEQALSDIIPVLIEKDRMRALTLLSDLLDKSLEQPSDPASTDYDYSPVWIFSIAEGPDRYHQDHKSKLVVALRDTAMQILRHDSSCVAEVVGLLERSSRSVHRRIALHLLTQADSDALPIAQERLEDSSYFDDLDLRHEYAVLLQHCFGKLESASQQRILKLIEDSPRIAERSASVLRHTGKAMTNREIRIHTEETQRDWLALIATDLPQSWLQRYQAYLAEHGPAHKVETFGKLEVRWGSESPLDLDALDAMAVGELIDYLSSWEPPKSVVLGPSHEGLGQKLGELAQAQPRKFTAYVSDLAKLEPTFVRFILRGWSEAIRVEQVTDVLDWRNALELSRIVANQPATDVEVQPWGRDQDWRWAKGQALDLLRLGFSSTANTIPISLRHQVWQVLRPLTFDTNPTPRHEERFGNDNMDPLTLSLNTTRGKALHAVFEYAWWLKSRLSSGSKTEGFLAMPEVQAVLERHLDTNVEPSLSIRAIYGHRLELLRHLDDDWVRLNINLIFPCEEGLERHRLAAWESLLTYATPPPRFTTQHFELLQEEYDAAVSRVGSPTSDSRNGMERRLASHLVAQHALKVSSSETSLLLEKFFDRAQVELRKQVLGDAGRQFQSVDSDDDELIQSLLEFWRWRFRIASTSAMGDELSAFGFWYPSNNMPEREGTVHLLEILEAVGYVEYEHAVVERLCDVAHREPLLAVKCVEAVLRGSQQTPLYPWLESAGHILETALGREDPEARIGAIDVINRLAAKGYVQFRHLLK